MSEPRMTVSGESEQGGITRAGPTLLNQQTEPLLRIAGLTVDFDTPTGWVRSLHGVNLEVFTGEILGLVGESGSGKSVTSMAVMQLLGSRARILGDVTYNEQRLLELNKKAMTQIRGSEIAMIFQDPVSSLNPVHTIGAQVTESVVLNKLKRLVNPGRTIGGQIADALQQHRGLSDKAARDESKKLLQRVGISDAAQRLTNYPHQLSGGMNQRVMIAMALAGQPQLLIADEPTTALDVTIQAQILELIRDLREEMNMSIMLITHDLAVVAETCNRMAVMYCGKIVEQGNVAEMFAEPRHPYTRGMLESQPRIDRQADVLRPIRGAVPAPHELPAGCAFEPRCPFSVKDCKASQPALETGTDGRTVACFNPQFRGMNP